MGGKVHHIVCVDYSSHGLNFHLGVPICRYLDARVTQGLRYGFHAHPPIYGHGDNDANLSLFFTGVLHYLEKTEAFSLDEAIRNGKQQYLLEKTGISLATIEPKHTMESIGLDIKIADLLLNKRSRNALIRGGIKTVRELNTRSKEELLSLPGFARKGLMELGDTYNYTPQQQAN